MSFLDNYSEQEIAKYVAESVNFAEVLIKMGRSANSGSNRMIISLYAKEHGIKTDHFTGASKTRTVKDIFIENSTATQNIMRKYYKQGNYSEYKCAICGQEPFWNGQELVLTLDHINGISNDHRLTNLRWVCPNCDRQLPTYGSKRKKIHTYCSKCGAEISHKNKTKFCKDCYWENVKSQSDDQYEREVRGNRKRKVKECPTCGKTILAEADTCIDCYRMKSRTVERPDPIDLAQLVKDFGFEGVGRKYGVSGKSIQKWCQSYKIPYTKKELVEWLNEQLGIAPEPEIVKKTRAEIVRPINQIDMKTGEILNTFASQADALRHLGKKLTGNHISRTCRGLQKHAYGYYWQYAD